MLNTVGRAAQEVNVIRGALDLTSKQALVGMTPMDKVGAIAQATLSRTYDRLP